MPPQYKQRFVKDWLKSPEFKDWLAEDPKNPSRAYCKPCGCYMNAKKKDLVDHKKSNKHRMSSSADLTSHQPSIAASISACDARKLKEKRVRVAQLKIVAYIAEHSAIRSVDHLCDMLPCLDDSSDILRKIHCRRTKCAAVITKVLSPCMREDLIADIGESYYSLVIDESTDNTLVKCLALVIRYFSETKKRMISTFYRLVPVDDGKSKTITDQILKCLQEDKLPVGKLVGIGADGASAMVGTVNSVATRLKFVVPHLVVVRCVCHSLHLAASAATKVLPKCLDFLVRETYNWFKNSTNRKQDYGAIYRCLNDDANPLKIPKIADTRWLSHEMAIRRILTQWDALKLHFELAQSKERCYAAEQLSLMYGDRRNKLYLIFLHSLLAEITKVNKVFQSEHGEATEMLNDLKQLYLCVSKKIVVPTHFERMLKSGEVFAMDFKDYIISADSLYLGSAVARELEKTPLYGQLEEIKKRARSFLVELACQLKKRLPDNIDVLTKMAMFSPSVSLSQVRPPAPIRAIASLFPEIVRDTTALESEYEALVFSDWPAVAKVDSVSFWGAALMRCNAIGEKKFGNIAKLALALLSLPLSNATVERVFSHMSIVKSKLRNRLQVSTVESILTVRYSLREQGGCSSFAPSDKMISMCSSSEKYACTGKGDSSTKPAQTATSGVSAGVADRETEDEDVDGALTAMVVVSSSDSEDDTMLLDE
jgi:hypothetical protein